jgi:hypothetical protein
MRMRRALAGGTLQTPALKNFSRMLLKVRCEHACRAAWRLNPDVVPLLAQGPELTWCAGARTCSDDAATRKISCKRAGARAYLGLRH